MTTGAVIARIVSQYSDKGSKAAQKDIAKTAKKIDDFNRKVVKAYAAGAAAAALFAYKVGKFAVKSAVEDAKSQEVLANVLRTTTNATNAQIAAVEDYITKQQLLTNVQDTELRASYATLVAATKDTTDAQYLNSLAVDVAIGANKDLSTVTSALAKAAQGNLRPLEKLNLGLDRGAIAAGDFKRVFAQLGQTYSGTAAKVAAKDPFTRLKIQFSEIAEQLGTALLPALTDLALRIQTEVVPQIEDWIEKNGTLISKSLLDLVKTIENIANAGVALITFLARFETLLKAIAFIAPFGFVASQLMLVGKFTKGVLDGIETLVKRAGGLKTVGGLLKEVGKVVKGTTGFWAKFAVAIRNVWTIISMIVPQAKAVAIAIAGIGAGFALIKILFGNNTKAVEKSSQALGEQARTALRASRTNRLTAEQLKKKTEEEKKNADAIAASAAAQKKALEQQKKNAKFEADYAKINARIAKTHGVKLLSAEEEKLVQINAAEALLNRQQKIDEINKQKLKDLKEEVLLRKVVNDLSQRYDDILKALADNDISSKDIVALAGKWGVTTEAVEAYLATIFAVEDGTISDDEVINLAQKWGSTQAQAAQYLDFFTALNDGVLSDSEIQKLMTKWKMTEDQVRLYADFVGVVNDGKLTDAEIIKIQEKWKLSTDQVVEYIKKIGAPVSYSGTLIDPAKAAEIGWLSATAALERYLALLKAGTGVVVGKTAPGGFVPGSGEDPAVIAAAKAAADAAAKAAADAEALAKEAADAAAAAARDAALRDYAAAKAAGDMETASLYAAQVGPSALAAGESGAIGAASIASALRAAEQALQNERIMSTYAGFRAKENADAVSAGILGGSMTDAAADAAERARFRALTQGTVATGAGISGGNLMGAPIVNITVQGSVTSEQDLVQTVRNGLLATQTNGNSLLLEAV
jgi:hypothetical protein